MAPLESLPYIGQAIAADLRAMGIATPDQLRGCDPLFTYGLLAEPMGHRHAPCVLSTLLAVEYFLATGETRLWWSFTAQAKRLLAAQSSG
ncbi:MAG: helix-hairpin-helix domain-containing protein [Nodosilinea sp.]